MDKQRFHEVVLQLAEESLGRTGFYPKNIRPIVDVVKGWTRTKIVFVDTRDGKNYEWTWETESGRLMAIEEANDKIKEYNKFAQKEFLNEAISKPAGVGFQPETPHQEIPLYDPWQFDLHTYSDFHTPNKDTFIRISNKELYYLKEELPEYEFVPRFNKTLLDYVKYKIETESKYGVPSDQSKWLQPSRAILDWGNQYNVNWGKITCFLDEPIVSESVTVTEEITGKGDTATPSAKPKRSLKFKQLTFPKGTLWKDITVKVYETFFIKISCDKGEWKPKKLLVNRTPFRDFSQKRDDNEPKVKDAWPLLTQMAMHGKIRNDKHYPGFSDANQPSKKIQKLNQCLKELIDVPDDGNPISAYSRGMGGWKPKFTILYQKPRIGDERSFDSLPKKEGYSHYGKKEDMMTRGKQIEVYSTDKEGNQKEVDIENLEELSEEPDFLDGVNPDEVEGIA